MAFRDGPLGDRKLPLSWSAAAATLVAILLALGLLLTDRREQSGPAAYGASRSEFDELMEPVTSVLATPVRWVGSAVEYLRGYAFAASENRKLKAEVAELQRYKDAAIALKSINDRYEALLNLRTEPPIPSVAARVIADARGPFSNARLADAGVERGVRIGDPVLSQHGVVGRVVGATRGASRILMLTDVDSRTPVTIDRTNARAILVGDGGPYPRLEYMRGQDPVRPGDVLLTSGDGGVYPRGLPVGVASKDLRGAWRTRLYSDAAPIEYVRILSYRDFSEGVDPKSLAPGAVIPPLTAEEQKSRQAALAPRPVAEAPKPATSAKPGAGPTVSDAGAATTRAAPEPAPHDRSPTSPKAAASAATGKPAASPAKAKPAKHKAVRAAEAAPAKPKTAVRHSAEPPAKPKPKRPSPPRDAFDGLL